PYRTMVWDGSIDLEIEFYVYDGLTRQPIRDARIEVQVERVERLEKTFVLHTDGRGSIKELCKECRTSGRDVLTDEGWISVSWGVQKPEWRFQVSADGYVP